MLGDSDHFWGLFRPTFAIFDKFALTRRSRRVEQLSSVKMHLRAPVKIETSDVFAGAVPRDESANPGPRATL